MKTTTQSTTFTERPTFAFKWLLFLVFILGIQNSFAQKTWDGGGDGTTWGSANNWLPDGVPTAAQSVTIASGQTVTINAAAVAASVANSGTLNINANLTISNGGSFTNFSGASVLFNSTGVINGGSNGSNGILIAINSGSSLTTAHANGLNNATGSFQHNPGSRSQTYSAGANYTYNGALQNIGADYPTNLTGKLTINSSGTVTLNSAKTIANGGSIDLVAGIFAAGTNLTMSATSTINRSGGSITGTIAGIYNVNYIGNSKSTGPELAGIGLFSVDFNVTAGQTVTLAANRAPDGNLNVTTGTLDLSTFTINRSAAGGTLSVANGATLKIGGTNSFPTNYTTTTLGTTSNVDYYGTAQTVTAQTYGNLILSTSGIKTMPATTTTVGGNFTTSGTISATAAASVNVTGDVTLGSGTTFNAASFTHNVGGNWSNNGATFTPGTSTIAFNGAAQTIGGSSSTTFNNVSLSGGTKTFALSTTINGNLSIASGAKANLGSITTHTAGTLTLGGSGTVAGQFGSTSSVAIPPPPVYTNDTYFTAGTQGYVTVGNLSCNATVTFGSIPSICEGALSYTIPYTAVTGAPNLYSISGSGITSVTDGTFNAPPSSVVVGLTSAALPGTISPSTFTVSNSITGCISANLSGSVSVTVTPTVGTPSTPSPAASTICQASSPTAYTTSATNATSYTWSVTGAGNTISGTGTTGTVTWAAAFSGSATVSVVANGCNGPSASASTTVTVTPTVGTPGTPSPAASTICQASSPTAYTTSATNATSYTWSVTGAGNTISGTGTIGTVTWAAAFSGSATVSVVANGCNGPSAFASTSVTLTPTVGTPGTPSPAASTICQASSPTAYTTSATNATSYTWSVTGAGNTISGTGTTGTVTWASGFSGSATVSVVANGCNGPSAVTSTTVTVTPTVGTPSFTTGATTVCQNAPNTTYIATATNNTGITYSISPAGAGSIVSSNVVNWNASFSGTATITASATGCNGPVTADRIVTVTPTVGTPSFTSGGTIFCQDAPNTTYSATASDTTGITYSVSPGTAGTIGSSTGIIDWSATFSGTATITASAAGCNGPMTTNRIVTITPTVGTPTFTAGATVVCQDAVNETYTATATNSTGITYSVLPVGAGTIDSSTGVMNWSPAFIGTATITASAAGCNGPVTGDRVVTVNPLPTVTATNLIGCPNTDITLIGSPVGGTFSITNPYNGAVDTTYTYTYTDGNGCTNTSNTATVTLTTEINFNNIDDNCDGSLFEGHAPVVVDITTPSGALATMNATINSTAANNTSPYSGAQVTYKFKVTKTNAPTSVAYVTSNTTSFIFSSASNAAHSSTYDVQATAIVNGEEQPYNGDTESYTTPAAPTLPNPPTQTGSGGPTCAYTLATINSYIYANNSMTQGATRYEFLIERMNGATVVQTESVATTGPYFRLINIVGIPATMEVTYATTYRIRVRYGYGATSFGSQIYTAYGNPCLVSTPALPLSSIVCGTTLASLNAYIYTSGHAGGANQFEFKVTRVSPQQPGELPITVTEEILQGRTVANFKLNMLNSLLVSYQKDYSVSVRYRINGYGTQQFSDWSTPCPLFTPDFPKTQVVEAQCGIVDEFGENVPISVNQYIYADAVAGATLYRFRLYNDEDAPYTLANPYDVSVYSPDKYVKLNQFPGLLAGVVYSVTVVAELYGEYANILNAKDCSVEPAQSTPAGPAKVVVASVFQATAYPNPFANNFMLDVKTESQSAVNVKVYDMIGRLIEQREATVSDMENSTIGDRYPSGVYNVVVSQEDNVQTVRVVKR